MSKEYRLADVAKFSGASLNEVTNWVRTKLIRPDIQESSGSGDHRTFGFLDVFEACIARGLNQLPGGCPTVKLSHALDAVRFETVLGETFSEPPSWSRFLIPALRDPQARFWLTRGSRTWKVATDPELAAVLGVARDVPVIALPLHTLLLDLEQATADYASDEDRAAAWMKKKRRPRGRSTTGDAADRRGADA